MSRLRRSVASARRLVTAPDGGYWRHGGSLLGCRAAAGRRGGAARAAAAASDARRLRRTAWRARGEVGATARHRGGPRALVDLLRAAGDGEDDARADRRGIDGCGLR